MFMDNVDSYFFLITFGSAASYLFTKKSFFFVISSIGLIGAVIFFDIVFDRYSIFVMSHKHHWNSFYTVLGPTATPFFLISVFLAALTRLADYIGGDLPTMIAISLMSPVFWLGVFNAMSQFLACSIIMLTFVNLVASRSNREFFLFFVIGALTILFIHPLSIFCLGILSSIALLLRVKRLSQDPVKFVIYVSIIFLNFAIFSWLAIINGKTGLYLDSNFINRVYGIFFREQVLIDLYKNFAKILFLTVFTLICIKLNNRPINSERLVLGSFVFVLLVFCIVLIPNSQVFSRVSFFLIFFSMCLVLTGSGNAVNHRLRVWQALYVVMCAAHTGMIHLVFST